MKKSAPRARKRPAASSLSQELTAGIAAALDKKAQDVIVLDLSKTSAFTDFFVICTGTNVRQVQAISDAICDAIGETGAKPALIEGYKRAEWILIDYFDVIFHIFLPATREFYSLERLWGDAEKTEVTPGSGGSGVPKVPGVPGVPKVP
jgi:ribosome-associated protein